MIETENNFPKTVVFKPENDDFIYLSRALTSRATYSRRAEYIHNVFLLINAIFVPGLLIFLGYWIPGLAIFIANILVVVFFVPMNQTKAELDFLRQYFDDVPDDERHEVELTDMGVNYRSPGHGMFMAWELIIEIQESPDAIYFFTKHGGFPVRKSAFRSDSESKGFVDHARNSVRRARNQIAASKTVASITN